MTDWVTYTHVYPRVGGGVTIQYWHVFAYNGLGAAGVGDHGGDWDATVHVQLGSDLQPEGVILSRHSHDSPGDAFKWEQMVNGGSVYDGTHPKIVIDGGGHASFANPAWDTGAGSMSSAATSPAGRPTRTVQQARASSGRPGPVRRSRRRGRSRCR